MLSFSGADHQFSTFEKLAHEAVTEIELLRLPIFSLYLYLGFGIKKRPGTERTILSAGNGFLALEVVKSRWLIFAS